MTLSPTSDINSQQPDCGTLSQVVPTAPMRMMKAVMSRGLCLKQETGVSVHASLPIGTLCCMPGLEAVVRSIIHKPSFSGGGDSGLPYFLFLH